MRALTLIAVLVASAGDPDLAAGGERNVVSKDGTGFVLVPSGRAFVPWGLNYDHDRTGRLLEDYWEREWDAVARDFRQMKALGANVVRIHLQFGRFMTGPDQPDAGALDRLAMLLRLAEEVGLYLDLTGLGCYHKADVPGWYDKLSEPDRWDAQARFWTAVAGRCKDSPAVFCYDLMNEPVVPRRPPARRLARPGVRGQALRAVRHPRPAGPPPAGRRPGVGPTPGRRHPSRG
ncbi:MAG: cellulase family glycosylhydrolase [Gemmataceae bacterium]